MNVTEAMHNEYNDQRGSQYSADTQKKAKGLLQTVKKLNKVFQSVKRLVFNVFTKKIVSSFVFSPPGLTPKGAGHSQVGVSELKV